MWLKLDMTISDLADDRDIAELKADLEKVLAYHQPWIMRPSDLPELPMMTHTGIVDYWDWDE